MIESQTHHSCTEGQILCPPIFESLLWKAADGDGVAALCANCRFAEENLRGHVLTKADEEAAFGKFLPQSLSVGELRGGACHRPEK
jgi:hypothetical protein